MLGACAAILQGSDADGDGDLCAGVGDHRATLRHRAGASDKQLDASARQQLRQQQARPILERLHAYLQEQQATALPKSPLGAAIGYELRNWVALTRYTEDGRLKIDNNGAEQALRPTCWGAKIGCSRAAKRRRTEPRSCVHWSRLPAPANQSVRLPVGHHRAGFDASGPGSCWS
jgi:hypothetical protein